MGLRNDFTEFARLDGYTGERDRLCRFHRHRDLAREFRKMERKERADHRPFSGARSRNRTLAVTVPSVPAAIRRITLLNQML